MNRILKSLLLITALAIAVDSLAQGTLQDADFKTESELILAGGDASLLLNDTKIYVTSVAKTLEQAIAEDIVSTIW